MAKDKPYVEPISLDLSPLNKKKEQKKKKIGVIRRYKKRKMISIRMRVEMINAMEDLIKKLKKKTKSEFSQSAVLEMAILLASKSDIEDLIECYGETFTVDKL